MVGGGGAVGENGEMVRWWVPPMVSVKLGINCILSLTDSLATRGEDGTWHNPKAGLTSVTLFCCESQITNQICN